MLLAAVGCCTVPAAAEAQATHSSLAVGATVNSACVISTSPAASPRHVNNGSPVAVNCPSQAVLVDTNSGAGREAAQATYTWSMAAPAFGKSTGKAAFVTISF
jgi:hypothetical protein